MDLKDEEQLSAVGVYLVAQSLAHTARREPGRGGRIGDAGYQVSVEKNNADGQAWFASILGPSTWIRAARSRPPICAAKRPLFGTLNHPGRRWGLGGIALAGASVGDSDVGPPP